MNSKKGKKFYHFSGLPKFLLHLHLQPHFFNEPKPDKTLKQKKKEEELAARQQQQQEP